MAQYGSYQYQSPEERALASITVESYDKDQAKNLIKLNNDVSYMAAYMRKMQKGIDEANANVLQQIQGFINDIIVLLGGGGATGLDFGDLRYVLQMIGALLGFDVEGGVAGLLPLNAFQAVWHMLSTYIFPSDQFLDVIYAIFDQFVSQVLDLFGDIPIVGQALQQFASIILTIRDNLGPVLDLLDALFGILDSSDPTSPVDFVRAIIAFMKDVPELIESVIDGIMDTIVTLPDQLIGLMQAIVQGINDFPEFLEEMISAAIDLLAELPVLFTEFITAFVELLITSPSIILELATAILGIILDLPNLVTRIINAIFGRSDPEDEGVSSGNFITNFLGQSFGWVTGFFNALTGQSRPQGDVTTEEASSQAGAMLESLIATAQTVADMQPGIIGGDSFNEVHTDMTYGWTVINDNPLRGYYETDGTQAEYHYLTDGTHTMTFLRNTGTAEDTTPTLAQEVTVVIGSFSGEGNQFFTQSSQIRLVLRANASGTQKVFAAITPAGDCAIGYTNGGGENLTSTTAIGTQTGGTKYTFRTHVDGDARKFGLYRNDILKKLWDDSSAVSAMVDGTNNHWGYGAKTFSSAGTSREPASIDAIAIATPA